MELEAAEMRQSLNISYLPKAVLFISVKTALVAGTYSSGGLWVAVLARGWAVGGGPGCREGTSCLSGCWDLDCVFWTHQRDVKSHNESVCSFWVISLT